MVLLPVWDPVERLLMVIVITLLVACGVQYLNKGRRRENFNEKIIMYGFASMVFCFAIERILTFLVEFYIPGTYSATTYYGDYDNIQSDSLRELIYLIYRFSFISWAAAYIIFFLAFEYNVKRTKYLFTIIQCSFIGFMSITVIPVVNIYLYILLILTLYTVIVFFFILIYYSRKTSLEFGAISSLLLFGNLLIMQGHELSSMITKSLGVFPIYVSPFFYIIGTIISVSPTVIDPKYFSRALTFWLVFGVLSIFLNIYLFVINLLRLVTYYVIFYLIVTAIISYSLYQVINTIKTQTLDEIIEIEEPTKSLDVYGMLTKPKHISEEEITYYKEQKICLVCKNKVARLSYICPDCDALYCVKCSNALSNLENACWVCNAPFDDSKPVKAFEKEEKELKVEELSVEENKIN